MPLQERQRLLRAYRAAIQAYHEAGASFEDATFHDALHRTELARSRVEAARIALLKHEHLHVASLGPRTAEPEADAVAMIGSTVALFNVATEHWDLFEIAVSGPPPAGALAYAPQPGNERGRWITDPRDMSAYEEQNVKLYFTEAGLAILREAGLEM